MGRLKGSWVCQRSLGLCTVVVLISRPPVLVHTKIPPLEPDVVKESILDVIPLSQQAGYLRPDPPPMVDAATSPASIDIESPINTGTQSVSHAARIGDGDAERGGGQNEGESDDAETGMDIDPPSEEEQPQNHVQADSGPYAAPAAEDRDRAESGRDAAAQPPRPQPRPLPPAHATVKVHPILGSYAYSRWTNSDLNLIAPANIMNGCFVYLTAGRLGRKHTKRHIEVSEEQPPDDG